MYKLIPIILYAILLAACSSSPIYDTKAVKVSMNGERIDFNDTAKIKYVLNQQYLAWRNVKYRLGGLTKNGIDCSGLVYRVYREKFGIDLPRTTEYQSKKGKSINKEQLKAGDLVFFKTGITTRHVGMYIDKGDFLHVSSSKGVKISNIKNIYWSRAYWKSRRM